MPNQDIGISTRHNLHTFDSHLRDDFIFLLPTQMDVAKKIHDLNYYLKL